MTSTTPNDFVLHTEATAPDAAKATLSAAAKSFGMIPNLHAVLAEAPQALEGYGTLMGIFEASSLDAKEQQLVLLATSVQNKCRYCVAGHSMIAEKAGLSKDAINAIRRGSKIADDKLEALHQFVALVVSKRGHVESSDTDRFVDAGYSRQAALEVILGIAVKTISNYTDHVAEVPLDGFMANYEWSADEQEGAAQLAPA